MADDSVDDDLFPDEDEGLPDVFPFMGQNPCERVPEVPLLGINFNTNLFESPSGMTYVPSGPPAPEASQVEDPYGGAGVALSLRHSDSTTLLGANEYQLTWSQPSASPDASDAVSLTWAVSDLPPDLRKPWKDELLD